MGVAYDVGARGPGGRIEVIHIEHIGAFWGGGGLWILEIRKLQREEKICMD